ncbi:Uncharacterized protein HZ326_12721 [Fusarium oxysporum f. sp. albedinis]|nr:Uncharacterized protein HZ326_12721 [Fusarium oxysporum f. sp. albedinis]
MHHCDLRTRVVVARLSSEELDSFSHWPSACGGRKPSKSATSPGGDFAAGSLFPYLSGFGSLWIGSSSPESPC